MTAGLGHITHKYDNVASQRVINAVQKASAKTGTDFSFLMQKAATESSFNASAKAKTSSATGLFQFIEKTWLGMVKNHGAKYGLQQYADKITYKDGKPCITDCDDKARIKKEILDLRKNPEISAYMAAEFSAENQRFLEKNTHGDVGSTELYFAHFMGAQGAAKFLNTHDANPNALAKDFFPRAARANKSIFYNKTTGAPRTFGEIYAKFAQKFSTDSEQRSSTTLAQKSSGRSSPSETQRSPSIHAVSPKNVTIASALSPASLASELDDVFSARTLPSFDDNNEKDDIIWNDDPRFHRVASAHARTSNAMGVQKLTPSALMTILNIQKSVTPAYMQSITPKHNGYNA